MRLSILPALPQVLGAHPHPVKLPGTDTSVLEDSDCIWACVYNTTAPNRGTAPGARQASKRSAPFLGDVTQCMRECIQPATPANELLEKVYNGCAKVLASGAAQPSAPAMALALAGLAVASIL